MELSEVEMLGEERSVDVIPTFAESTIHLIGGDVGPLEPGVPIQVPLYIALYLKRRHKCRIRPPHWLAKEFLEELVKEEKDSPLFAKIPERMIEIATLLLREASDDIHDGDDIKILLKDLWDTREAKLRKDVSGFIREGEASVARVENLSQLEVNRLRDPVLAALRLKSTLSSALTLSQLQDDASHNDTASFLHNSL